MDLGIGDSRPSFGVSSRRSPRDIAGERGGLGVSVGMD
jgi:hypothetical protein